MVRALQLLKDDYRRHHFVIFNPDFEMFLRDVKTALDAHQLPIRVFDALFGDTNITPHPDCNGCATGCESLTEILLALHRTCWS